MKMPVKLPLITGEIELKLIDSNFIGGVGELEDATSILPKVKCPTLIIVGGRIRLLLLDGQSKNIS